MIIGDNFLGIIIVVYLSLLWLLCVTHVAYRSFYILSDLAYLSLNVNF